MRAAYLPGDMGSLKATVSGSLLSRKQVRVVPLRPGPVSTMFRSLALETPKREASLLSMRRMIAYSLPGFQRVELAHHGGGDLLDDLRLFGGEILAPTARARLPIELALPFHVLGDRLPGVPLDRPRQLAGVHLYPEGEVQATHGSEGVGSQVFVEDHRLGALVGFVGAPGILHVAKVLLGRSARHGLGALVGEAPDPRAAAPPLPAVLPRGVQRGRHYVSGISDKQDHPALRQRLHQERGPHAAARLLDYEVVLRT